MGNVRLINEGLTGHMVIEVRQNIPLLKRGFVLGIQGQGGTNSNQRLPIGGQAGVVRAERIGNVVTRKMASWR